MTSLRPLLMLALLVWVVVADQESCKGRCTEGFNATRKCQCDELCSYYQSCCADFMAECKPQVTRGDVFHLPEDEYGTYDYGEVQTVNRSVEAQPESPTLAPVLQAEIPVQAPVLNPEKEAPSPGRGDSDPGLGTSDLGTSESPAEEETCSGKPFDAFTDLKNGSLFAFRGLYCYELDEKAVRPGYPKLIRDVWGIEGPIDAAFTRFNCQGKTYLFKVLCLSPTSPPHPTSPTPNPHRSSQLPQPWGFRNHYWEYVFQQQPSREECEGSSQPAAFKHFALMQRDSWEDIFRLLFWGGSFGGAGQPQLISRDWFGLPGKLDAAMAGHIYISGSAPSSPRAKMTKSARRHRKRYRSLRSRGRGRGRARSQNPYRRFRSTWLSWFSSEELGLGADNYDNYEMDWLVPATCEPIQSVYFFSEDKYYRVNLRTRRVDSVIPPYPRSIAQYWLGCPVPGHA
uniref:Vitronectin n=1 Tax=Capra hircus TaxID=9925 RepID=A0A452ELN6_CAPHI